MSPQSQNVPLQPLRWEDRWGTDGEPRTRSARVAGQRTASNRSSRGNLSLSASSLSARRRCQSRVFPRSSHKNSYRHLPARSQIPRTGAPCAPGLHNVRQQRLSGTKGRPCQLRTNHEDSILCSRLTVRLRTQRKPIRDSLTRSDVAGQAPSPGRPRDGTRQHGHVRFCLLTEYRPRR